MVLKNRAQDGGTMQIPLLISDIFFLEMIFFPYQSEYKEYQLKYSVTFSNTISSLFEAKMINGVFIRGDDYRLSQKIQLLIEVGIILLVTRHIWILHA